jgi:tetratricopeptide (TPR) repeat protein
VDQGECRASGRRGRRALNATIADRRRRRRVTLISLPLLLVGLAGAAAPPPLTPQLRSKVERLRDAAEAVQRNDCKAALALARPLIGGGEAPALPEELQALTYDLVVACEADGEKGRAYADALAGTRLERSSDDLWHQRLMLEIQADRYDAAVATLEAMTAGRGAALSSVPDDWFRFIGRKLEADKQSPLRSRFLKAMSNDAYVPAAGYGRKDSYRVPYAIILAERGDREGARLQLAALRSPYWLRQVSVDARLRAFLPADLDLRAATEAMLATDKEAIARHPEQLDPLLNAAGDLRELGRPQEALQLLQGAAARIDDAAAFSDRDDKLAWWWDGVARAYASLGKYEEAVAAYRKGAALSEGSGPNVSQVINLAEFQIDYGRGEDALKTLTVFDDPKRKGSAYGEMQVRFARGCAHALAGDKAAAAADLAYARAHEKDDAETVSNLLLCMGDMDGAAAIFVRRLDDSDQRVDALLELSDYQDPPVAVPPGPVESGLNALKERPDVKAAIARAGGVRRFNVGPVDD